MMKNKSRKKDNFWFIYALLCSFLAVLIISVTVFLYDYVKVFEESRPEHAVRKYAESLSAEEIAEEFDAEYSGFEKSGALTDVIKKILSENEITYSEVISDASENVFDLYCDGKLMTVTLVEGEEIKYGFSGYSIGEKTVYESALEPYLSSLTVIVPETAALYINEIKVPKEYINGEKFADATVTEFERGEEFRLALVSYEIDGLLGEYDVRAVDENGEIILENQSLGVYTSVSSAAESVFKVTAPKNASLTVNGIEVAEKYIKETVPATDANIFESETAPEIALYEIVGLRYKPTVTAVLNGNELPSLIDGEGNVTFEYPDSYKASFSVRAPLGVTVLCNGKPLGEEYLAADGEGIYGLPESVSKYAKPDVSYVTYTVGGFYGTPKFATEDGNVSETVDGVQSFFKAPNSDTQEIIRNKAQDFTELFMKYSYEGTDFTKANLAAVLEHVKADSSAYKIIEVSYESMRYNSNFKVDKLETEIYDFIEYADGCYGVSVDFDSHGMYAKFEKVAVGTYRMIWIVEDGKWLLAEFIFS